MIRVLHVISSFGRGGAPALIVNYMTHLTDENIKFDFLLRSENNAFEDEIKKHGGIVYITPSFPKHIFSNFFNTVCFFVKHREYDIVQIHCNALIYILPAIICKLQHRKCVIIHSHNTKAETKLGALIHKINKKFVNRYTDVRFACSDLAGEWMFPKDYLIVKNAVDPKDFFYDLNARNFIREKYRIVNKRVYIHVGRFEKQKNHEFIIEIFAEILKRDKNSVLLLLGEGSLINSIKQKVKAFNIENSVFFLGVKSNINDFLSAADIMLFPSFWEGLPVSLVEAQYSKLKILCSDCISKEIMVTPLINSLSLKCSAYEWAEKALQLFEDKIDAKTNEKLDLAGYNIQIETEKLQNFYKKKVI